MLTATQREKLANTEAQDKLLFSLEKITLRILHFLETDQDVIDFDLEQRNSMIEALKESELVSGPIGPAAKNRLMKNQKELEEKMQIKLDQSRKELSQYMEQTRDLKKYNLKNVR